KVLLVSDAHFLSNIGQGKKLQMIYNNTADIATFRGYVTNYNIHKYPYRSMTENSEGSLVEVRINKPRP
ncbi:MAG: glycosyltransferase, partial [Thermoproteota archaeon]|nr:glycosyltransferase [Thermoproteota archaeon]